MTYTFKSHRREYTIWLCMKTRCYNSKHPSFAHYGARGIKISPLWLYSFQRFMEDMGPSHGLSLDRIDNDGDYGPDNCRWADRIVQMRNTSRTRRSLWNGGMLTWIEIAMDADCDYHCLRNRLNAGKPVEEAVMECRERGLKYFERAKCRNGTPTRGTREEAIARRRRVNGQFCSVPSYNNRNVKLVPVQTLTQSQ